MNLTKQIKAEESIKKDYEKEQDRYETLKKQFQDEDYLELYAKGQFLLSSEGEQIFKISDDETKRDDSE